VLGFTLHFLADLQGPSRSLFQNIINGAPPFAPLLLPNLVILALIGFWVIRVQMGIDKSKPTL
jgi:hypothetical protein